MENNVQADVEFKTFWREPSRFADLFNGTCFDGEVVIKPEDLQEADAEVSGVIEGDELRTSIQRTRDIVKKFAYGMEFVILGIENQKTVDDTMPLRVMVYDGQNYLKQLKEKRDSKAYKGRDKYIVAPVITLVVYYGKNPWDGPLWLSQMMSDMPIKIRELVSDYKMNLVQVLQDGTEHFSDPDVKMMFEYAQAFMKKDQEKLEELNQYYTVKQDVLYMIGQVTDSKELVKNIRLEEKEEGNMCEYLEEIRKSGLEEGEKLGREAGEKLGREAGEIRGKILGVIDFMRELQYGDSAIEGKLMEKYQLSPEMARDYVCGKLII